MKGARWQSQARAAWQLVRAALAVRNGGTGIRTQKASKAESPRRTLMVFFTERKANFGG